MKKSFFLFILIFFNFGCDQIANKTETKNKSENLILNQDGFDISPELYQPVIEEQTSNINTLINEKNKFNFYQKRYNTTTFYQKIIDNFGEGSDKLYGLRNMRSVLNGIIYRGGANNFYHQTNKRDNKNPLPEDGLRNLCQEGFSTAIYLYIPNFNKAKKEINCLDFNNQNNTLKYIQKDYNDDDKIYDILELVYENIKTNKGPIYIHCWNGWHASGMISALILKQFCSFESEEAVKYWDKATDGVNKSSSYNAVRQKIRNFKPYDEFLIDDDRQEMICNLY